MNIRTPEPTDLPMLKILWQEAFGDTLEFINTFFETAFDCSRCFCAVDNGFVTAALYWFDCKYHDQPVAYLYAIATAKAYQGQGICHRLMEHTHKHLQNTGYIGAVLVPGSASLFDFYKDMGYQTDCFVKEFHCNSATETNFSQHDTEATPTSRSLTLVSKTVPAPFSLRLITTTEYATLRRQLLPKDGILQENICLAFLQTQATLYAGDDFILAAHAENQKLFVPELLGNSAKASQILHALDCKEGLFRTPGIEKPFAMYLSLSANYLPLPAYFGLAFD